MNGKMDRDNVEREAADWVVRHDRGLTAAEQDQFLDWLAAKPEHSEALSRQRGAWDDFDVLEEWRPKHSMAPNPDLLAQHWPARTWRWARLVVPIAAVIALGIYLPMRFERSHVAAESHMAPVRIVATEYRLHELPDGSEIDLNAGTEIAVDYSAGRRAVHLIAGEAFFTVVKDPARPFLVTAAGTDVHAVGTAFNVRLAADAVEVLVTSGKVVVDRSINGPDPTQPLIDETSAVELEPGHQSVWSLSASNKAWDTRTVPSEEISLLLEWKPAVLEFSSTPLLEAVAQFNRHNHIQVVIADEALGTTPIAASFRSNNVDGFVRLLEMTGQVRADRGESQIVLYSR